jgi:DNA-binding PadR family transcriptional regulator
MRFTEAQQKIVDFLEQQGGSASSFEIGRGAPLGSARLYQALHELEAFGVLTSEWAEGEKFPRRRLYRVVPKSYFSAEFSPKDYSPVARR